MVDDDISPPPTFLDALTPVPPGYGMVGITHPSPLPFSGQLAFQCCLLRDGELHIVQEWHDGWNDIDAMATGCVAIPRRVLEDWPNPFRVSNDPNAAITSDDFIFCQDLRIMGEKIAFWADPMGTFCEHIHNANLAAIMLHTGAISAREVN